MKAIMAEAETGKKPAARAIPSTLPAPRHEQVKPADTSNWRAAQRSDPSVLLRTPSGGTPWRLPSVGNMASSLQTPPMTPTMRPVRSKEDILQSVKLPQTEARREPATPPHMPGMGPVFTPKKTSSPSKATTSPGFRRVS